MTLYNGANWRVGFARVHLPYWRKYFQPSNHLSAVFLLNKIAVEAWGGLRAMRKTGHITYHGLAGRRPSKVIQEFCDLKRKEAEDISALHCLSPCYCFSFTLMVVGAHSWWPDLAVLKVAFESRCKKTLQDKIVGRNISLAEGQVILVRWLMLHVI